MREMKNSPVLLRRKDYRAMDWKNGGGTCNEIAISPSNALFSHDKFLWRLSSAEVHQGGKFSEFPGYDRYLALVEGDALKFHFGKCQRETLLQIGDVLQFSGDEPVSCELVSGSVTDLGLIFDRERVKAKFEMIRLSKKPRSFQLEGRTTLIFGVTGTIGVELFPGEDKYTIQPGDTLRLDSESKSAEGRLILLEPKVSKSIVAWVELT